MEKITNTFILGDAVDVMRKMPSDSVDLITTDPPYNLGKDYGNNIDYKEWHQYEVFTQHWLDESIRLLKPTGSIYVFMGVRLLQNYFHLWKLRDYYLTAGSPGIIRKAWEGRRGSLRDMMIYYILPNPTTSYLISIQ